MNTKKFESKTGIKIEDLNEDIFISLVKNPDYREFFSDEKTCLDLIDEIIERKNDDIGFIKELYTTKYLLELNEDSSIIDNVFEKYRESKITRDDLLNEMKKFRSSSDPIFVISVFICSMIALEDVDLSLEIDILNKNIEGMKDIFSRLGRIETSYSLRCDLIDIMYILREKFFERYNISLDIDWVDDETERLYEFEDQFNNREIPEIGVKPEDLGFLDITKLKGGEDGKN